MGELARAGEVELVVHGLRAVRLQVHLHGARELRPGQRDGPDGRLHQHAQPLPRRGRVGHHDLTAVDGVDEEFTRHVFIDPLAVLVAEPVGRPVVVLADEHRHLAVGAVGGADLFVEGDDRAGGGERHLAAVEGDLMLRGLERQVEDRQGEHHLGEVARGIGEVPRQERAAAVAGVVRPERADGHEAGSLLVDAELVVVVLGPLHRRVELAVELADQAALLAVVVEVEVIDVRVAEGLQLLDRGVLLLARFLPCPVLGFGAGATLAGGGHVLRLPLVLAGQPPD